MSIEVELGRIATALEKQNALTEALVNGKGNPLPPPAPLAAPKVEKKAPKNAPVVEPEAVDAGEGMFEDGPTGVTLDALKELLTQHAKAFGTKVTLAMIISHGADKDTPKIATIPEVNWAACFTQATADLKKVKK